MLLSITSFSQALIQGDLQILPIVDNAGTPYAYVRDFRIQYVDSGRCTDVSFIELVTDSGFVQLKPVNYRISCVIVAWGRATKEDIALLKRRPLVAVRVMNPQSENIFYFLIKNQRELQNLLP